MTYTDGDFARWTMNRLTTVHGDPPLADFIQRLREIAERLDQAEEQPAVRAFNDYTVEQASLAMDFLEAIVAERKRAHEKHGATSMEQSPLLAHRRASILAEEAVECGKALNDYEHHAITLFDPITDMTSVNLGLGVNAPVVDELDKELIQTAAMAYTWWANRRGHRLPSPKPAPERPTTWEEGECPIRVGWHHAAHHVTKDCVRSRSLDASTAEPAPPPVPKAPTIPVLINGTPYTGTLDPATGTLHVHTVPPITEPPADISWATFEDHRGRRTDYQGNPIPPITDDEGGRRGD